MRHLPILLSVTALLGAASAQVIVAPAGYDLIEGNANNAFPWNRGTASIRTAFLYDSSHFTSQSITAPVTITRVRFRADATTSSWSGGTYGQVQIDMSTAAVDYLGASTTFDSNHGPDRTTVINGPVTIQGGTGNGAGVPGPWHIDLPLTTPFLYDPSSGNDLCIDILLDGATFSGGSLVQADHVSAAGVPPPLCSRVYNSTANIPNPATGTVGTNYGAVVEFTCQPGSGYATSSTYGTGCYDQAVSFYELFPNNAFDLSGSSSAVNSFLMVSTGTGYAVLPGSNQWFTPVSARIPLTDDSVSSALTLPFPLVTPAGVTTTLVISSNGFIWTAPNTVNGCCNGDVGLLLSQAERFAPFWQDLNPGVGGNVHFDIDPSNAAAYVTFDQVPEFGQAANLNTFQVAFFSSGSVEYRYQQCGNISHTVLTGWSPGNNARNPGPRDLSAAIPFVTAPDRLPLALAVTARPVLGSSASLRAERIPTGTPLGAFVLSFTRMNPPLDLTSIGMPGCFQYVGLDASLAFVNPGATALQALVLPNNPLLAGQRVYCQAATFTPGFNALGVLSSNGLELKLDRL